MSRQLFCFSVICCALSACSSVAPNKAQGDFDYANKQEPKEFIVPDSLNQPNINQEYVISDKINNQGAVGEKMDIRSPSLVLPLAASSRTENNSSEAIIWFDKVLENTDLLTTIRSSLFSQLKSDSVGYDAIETLQDNSLKGHTETYESHWYHNEVETGWLFTDIESSTSMRFRYEFFVKPHGRSLSLKVSLIDYMKTDSTGGSKNILAHDKERFEMSMLNEITSQVDYDYRLQHRDNRLMRANQQLVSIGQNNESENAFIVEMELDDLWDNMPIFFEKHGFTITDLNESNHIYYVDFVKPDTSIWDKIWGDELPTFDLNDEKYQIALSSLNDDDKQTSVTIYNEKGEPLSLETVEKIFPIMKTGLSFKDFF